MSANSPNPERPESHPILDVRFCVFRSITDLVSKEEECIALRPLHDRILVKRLEDGEQTSEGGIIIPDTAKEKPQQANVLAVGDGCITDDGKVQPMDVKTGDKVVFSKYAGTEVKVDGDDLLVIREDDVLGVIE